MRNLAKSRLSLRTRIFASVALMVIPAAVLLISAFNALNSSVDTLERLVDRPLEDIRFVSKLRSQIIQTELPFAQFLNRGEAGDRETFIRLSVEIDRAFENMVSARHFTEPQADLLKLARAEWLGAKALGEKLLSKTDIPDLDELTGRMDEFSRHLSRSIAVLDDLSQGAYNDIRDLRFAAQDEEWESMSILLLIFCLGILLAVLESIALQHAVLDPLSRLERTITKYSQGDLSSRVHVKNNDEIGHMASAFNSMAERFANIQNELDYISIHDNLTGLYDRTKFHDEMNVEMQRAKRHNREFSLLLIDIENFRHVNETFGRLVGDSVLCSVAMQIGATIRPTDIASRYDGDKFAVLLSETPAQGAQETADRLVGAISEHPINIGDGKSLKITTHIGLATYPGDADIDSALFALATQALEKAKQLRKNSVSVSQNKLKKFN